MTTNSITQIFNRKVLQEHLGAKDGSSLAFAIPDHPWVDTATGANVRIAMTGVGRGEKRGTLGLVVSEERSGADEVTVVLVHRHEEIQPNLTIGAAVTNATPLAANKGICQQGVKLVGDGFLLEREELEQFEGDAAVIKPFLSNKDLVQRSRDLRVIDFHGLEETQARALYPAAYQRVYDTVRLFRLQNRDAQRQRKWWLFGRSNEKMRASLKELSRYVVTPEVAQHRPFVFVDGAVIPDASLYAIASDDAFILGVLSSRIHIAWALATGGKLGVGNDPRYQNTQCFDPFPFPVCDEEQKQRIRELADALDAHRKRQQEQHPHLTITEMYNVLASLRAGEPLGERERDIHERGLVSVLRGLHDDLDRAVCDAYGWEHDISDEEILQRLVSLNHERAEEERKGLVL